MQATTAKGKREESTWMNLKHMASTSKPGKCCQTDRRERRTGKGSRITGQARYDGCIGAASGTRWGQPIDKDQSIESNRHISNNANKKRIKAAA
jgi:hypothetical protein